MTEAMQPPTYDDVVQRYGLKILAKGADLVLSIGDCPEFVRRDLVSNDEWLKKPGHPTQQQLKSIQVLADALEEPIAPDGANHKLSRHVCQDTLQLLSGESFSMLGRRFFAFANSMVQRRVRA